MKLSARQKYDYRDLDRGEAQLMRVGHALWRDRRKLGDTVAEREGINAALESVWKAKREYRGELAKKRTSRSQSFGPLGLSVEAVGRVKARRDCTRKHAVDGSAAGRSGRSVHENLTSERRFMPFRKSAKPIGDRLLTLAEAAEILRLNPRTVRAYVQRGQDRSENYWRTLEIQACRP
jgi:hypothetical protein